MYVCVQGQSFICTTESWNDDGIIENNQIRFCYEIMTSVFIFEIYWAYIFFLSHTLRQSITHKYRLNFKY